MMSKSFCLLAALLATSVVLADEAATTPAASTQAQPQTRPLHRHPTLFSMLQRNNSMRRRVGLRPHRMNPALAKAAQDHANYMARTGQFSHYVNSGPQGRASKYGFRGGVRENIAYGTRTVDGAFNMWQNSGAHYASIVSGTADAGFGYAVSTNGQAYWVGLYGTPPAGDEVGETEEFVAKYLEEEKQTAEKLAAEKTAAEKDPNVKPASATLDPEQKPASEAQPAAATDSAVGK
jgi:uncharacterized protein YkwD